jgi:glutathione S-transferase
MSDQQPITVHGFETSNNMKVRIALGYKGIPYTFHTIDPADRAEIVRISGQYLTPVLVHGDRVVFDSAAILRYLDTSFAETPRLFGGSPQEQWTIEDWELFARANLAAPMLEVVHARIAGKPLDEVGQQRCAAAFSAAMDRIARALAGRDWLVGDRMSAADITAAAVVRRIRQVGMFELPTAPELLDWEARVLEFDGPSRIA